METIVFNPNIADLKELVKKIDKAEIKGIDDVEGYKKAKEDKKLLAKLRTTIKSRGLELRRESINYRNKVLKDEKELLGILSPTELQLGEEIGKIDLERKRKEREIALPLRRGMVDGVGRGMLSDEEILDMDEKEFGEFYRSSKELFDEQQAREKQEKEQEEIRKSELKEAKQQAKINERERMKRMESKRKERIIANQKEDIEIFKRKQREEIERVKEEAEQKIIDAKNKKESEELAIKDQKERDEKNKLYIDFLEKNGCSLKKPEEFKVFKEIVEGEIHFTLFKKIDSLTIK